jgi:hypothetical protein
MGAIPVIRITKSADKDGSVAEESMMRHRRSITATQFRPPQLRYVPDVPRLNFDPLRLDLFAFAAISSQMFAVFAMISAVSAMFAMSAVSCPNRANGAATARMIEKMFSWY